MTYLFFDCKVQNRMDASGPALRQGEQEVLGEEPAATTIGHKAAQEIASAWEATAGLQVPTITPKNRVYLVWKRKN